MHPELKRAPSPAAPVCLVRPVLSPHLSSQGELTQGKLTQGELIIALLTAALTLSACEPPPPKTFGAEEAGALAGETLLAGRPKGASEAGDESAGQSAAGLEGGGEGGAPALVEAARCEEGLSRGGRGLEAPTVEQLEEGSPLRVRSARGARGAQRLWRPEAQAPQERRRALKRLSARLMSEARLSLILDLSAVSSSEAESSLLGLTLIAPLGEGLWHASLERSEALSTQERAWLEGRAHWLLEPLDLIDSRLTRLARAAEAQGDQEAQITARVTLWGADVEEARAALQGPELGALREAIKAQREAREAPQGSAESYIQHERHARLSYQGAQGRWTSPPVSLAWSRWLELARSPRVVLISPAMPRPVALNEPSRSITRAEEVQGLKRPVSGMGHYRGWTGRGVRVAVMDSGVMTHPDFFRYSSSGEQRSDRVVGDLPTEGEGHGTIVAGILAGNGWLSQRERSPLGRRGAPLQWRGQAPEVSTIYSYLMLGEQGADLRPPWEQAFDEPEEGVAHLINHSHTYGNGYYGPENQGYDAFVAARPVPSKDQASDEVDTVEGAGEGAAHPRPVFFAAGNNGFWEQADFLILKGYYGLMVNFKNNIIVGSIESNDSQHADSSSLGPTIDGRMKPDVVAPGSSDPRPLNGFKMSVGELRLHARPESGARDKVWRWSQSSGWVGEAGFDISQPELGAQLKGEVLEGFSFGNSYRTRLSWQANEDDPPLDPSRYDQLSFEIKFELPEEPQSLNGLRDRPPLPLSSEPPQFFAFNWADDQGSRFDGAQYYAYGEEAARGEWFRVRVPLGDDDWAGEGLEALHRLRITPGLYLTGVYAPSIRGGYELSSGTSMASPAAAGVGALALQQLHETGSFDLESAPPRPATIRGLLSHTARDLSRERAPDRAIPNPDTGLASVYGAGPDWNTGYGLVDAWALSRLIDAHTESTRWREELIEPDVIHRYRVRVSGGTSLKVSLAWDDPAASLLLEQWAPKLIHDLDLAVSGPLDAYGEGPAYGPWVLTPPPLHSERYTSGEDEFTAPFVVPAERCMKATLSELWAGEPREGYSPSPIDVSADGFVPQLNRGCIDELNNYEQVLIDDPAPGLYELVVRGPRLGGSAQSYSLIVSEGCEWSAP